MIQETESINMSCTSATHRQKQVERKAQNPKVKTFKRTSVRPSTQTSFRKVEDNNNCINGVSCVHTDSHCQNYKESSFFCSTRVSAVLSSTRNLYENGCLQHCSPSVDLSVINNYRNNDFVDISNFSHIEASSSTSTSSSAFISCYTEAPSTIFTYMNDTHIKNVATSAVASSNRPSTLFNGTKDKRPPCDGKESLPSFNSHAERSPCFTSLYSASNTESALSKRDVPDEHNMSIESDATAFMNAPLCAPAVTGHHVSKSYSKNIAKKLKRFSNHFCGSKKARSQLQILAVI